MLWAAGYLFRKTALYGISPLLLTFFTATIVAITFQCIFRYRLRDILRAFTAHPWLYFGLATTGVGIGTTCMFFALDHLDLGITVVLEKLQPVFTVLFASLYLGERISPRKLPWMGAALAASYFVSMKDPFDLTFAATSLVGVGAVVLAALSWGVSSVIGKQLTSVEPDARMVTLLRFALGSFIMLPFFLFRDALGLRLQLDAYVITVTALCAILSTGLGYLLFYRGLRGVSATLSGFLELVTPVVGVLLGVVFLGESLTVLQLLAAAGLLWAIAQLCKVEAVG